MHARRRRKTREGHAVLYILPKETHGPYKKSGSLLALVEISANQGLFRNRLGASGGRVDVSVAEIPKGAKSRAGGQSGLVKFGRLVASPGGDDGVTDCRLRRKARWVLSIEHRDDGIEMPRSWLCR